MSDKNREKLKKRQTFDLSYFISSRYFDGDGSQNCIVFQTLFKSFTTPTASERILE